MCAYVRFSATRSSGTKGFLFSSLKENSCSSVVNYFDALILGLMGFLGGSPLDGGFNIGTAILVYLSPVAAVCTLRSQLVSSNGPS